MSEVPDHAIENILSSMEEIDRLRTLSNEELVRERIVINFNDGDDELHLEEMMNRLWSGWAEMGSEL